MSAHLHKELEKLRDNLLSLGKNVEETVKQAVLALKHKDVELAKTVISNDHSIDLKEVVLEEECLKILALHQPVANDLRFVIAVLKINNDLERVGDLSVNIAERVEFLSKRPPVAIPFDFDDMAEKTLAMLEKSFDSILKVDTGLAEQVCADDSEVDAINRQMYAQVYEGIKQNPEHVEALIHYLSVSRHLERIADYATNIAEDVIYMIEGTIVRHQPEEY